VGVAIDPVCGMEVDEATAAATSAYDGRPYYFCAAGCKAAFDANPTRYLNSTPADGVAHSTPDQVPRPIPGSSIVMPVDVAIKSRRSITRMTPDAVPLRAIEQILDAAVWAPNHHLTEPWEFHVLLGEAIRRFAEIRREFRQTLLKNPTAPETKRLLDKIYADAAATPLIIVVTTTDPPDPDLRDDDHGATMCAIQNMLLVATGLGLGGYLRTGGFIHYPALRAFLGVPEGRRIAGVVYLGYPAHVPPRRRTPFQEKTRWLA
jgi:nitroreductase/YHS domain-containing protein